MISQATFSVPRQRLASGCCPVHDQPLTLLSGGDEPEGEPVAQSDAFYPAVRLGSCPCADCSVLAWLMPNPCENALLGPWAHLCGQEAADRGKAAGRLSRVVLSAFK